MASCVTRQDVREHLKNLLIEVAGIGEDAIGDGAKIDGELRLESVAFVEIQVALEEEYDIQLDPIEVVERNEFSRIVDYIYDLAAARS